MAHTTKAPRLFTVKLWQEEAAGGALEWRGKVQALPEGEAYYFRDWTTLVAQLGMMLGTELTDPAVPVTPDGNGVAPDVSSIESGGRHEQSADAGDRLRHRAAGRVARGRGEGAGRPAPPAHHPGDDAGSAADLPGRVPAAGVTGEWVARDC